MPMILEYLEIGRFSYIQFGYAFKCFKSFVFSSLSSIWYEILILTYSFSNHGTFLEDPSDGCYDSLRNKELLPQLPKCYLEDTSQMPALEGD